MSGASHGGDVSASVEARFAAALARLVPGGSRLLLAISGGSDSMALLHLAAGAAREVGLALGAGFVDHGLRAGAKAEWELVRDAARGFGIEARRAAVEPVEAARGRAGESLQQWARDARYRLLAGMAREGGYDHLATAHTRDDQAETVLLRLLRGAGIDGLGGIPERRDLDGIALVRPLLDRGREELRGWLRERGAAWAEDPSNADGRFERVRVREELLPSLEGWHPGVGVRLAALAGECREISGFLDRVCEEGGYLRPLRLVGGVALDVAGVPAAVRSRAIRALLHRVRGDLRGVDRGHVEDLEGLALRGVASAEVPLPGSAVAWSHEGRLLVFPRALPPAPSGAGQPAAMGPGRWRLRFAALGAVAEIEAAGSPDVSDLELRSRRSGDRLHGSDRKLKEILNEARVPRPYRDFVPVLAGEGGVISCPGFLPSRRADLKVRWLLDEDAPFLDVDFPMG